MTLQQRFLLFFSDYREAIEDSQTATDEVRRAHIALDCLQDRYDALVRDSLARERDLTDKLMVVRYGAKAILSPEQLAEAVKDGNVLPPTRPTPSSDARSWKAKSTIEALRTLDDLVTKAS